mmetsp:Transcript_82562/g.256456  ORF Transcript_82562/g.256456 Transcript_82562/m.256456 type:complete len:750 (+) Transcript_82562:56-2305(+)
MAISGSCPRHGQCPWLLAAASLATAWQAEGSGQRALQATSGPWQQLIGWACASMGPSVPWDAQIPTLGRAGAEAWGLAQAKAACEADTSCWGVYDTAPDGGSIAYCKYGNSGSPSLSTFYIHSVLNYPAWSVHIKPTTACEALVASGEAQLPTKNHFGETVVGLQYGSYGNDLVFCCACGAAANCESGGATCLPETSSTTTRTTVTSSMTATMTVTATTTPGVGCSATRLYCPLPPGSAGAYSLQGSQSAGAACQSQSGGGLFYFDVVVNDCNVTREVTQTKVIYTATMVWSPPLGSLVFDQAFPTIECRCEYSTMGTAQSKGAVVELQPAPGGNSTISGESQFDPVLRIYTDSSFSQALSGGQALPSNVGRFHLEAWSPNLGDVVGLVDCTAAPSSIAADPYAQPLLQASCPVAGFDLQTSPTTATNEARFSTRLFKFAGMQEVYFTCSVLRCTSKPCGVCVRRLEDGAARRLAVTARTTVAAKLPSDTSGAPTLVLPAAVFAERLSPVWVPSGAVVPGSLRLYGWPGVEAGKLAEAAGKLTAQTLGVPVQSVRVLRIATTTGSGLQRRLMPQPGRRTSGAIAAAEALVLDFEVVDVQADQVQHIKSWLTSTAAGGGAGKTFAESLLGELGLGNTSSAELVQVSFGPPLLVPESLASHPTAMPVVVGRPAASPDAEEGPSQLLLAWVIAACSAALGIGGLTVAAVVVLRRPGPGRDSAPAAKSDARTKAEDGAGANAEDQAAVEVYTL